jgi:hypothetical protein
MGHVPFVQGMRSRHPAGKEDPMKHYLLSVCYPPGATQPEPERLKKIRSNLAALRQEMIAAGAWVFAGGLHPASSATVVQLRNGEVLTTDGPFAEGKEYLGGITIIQAPDLDVALGWARKQAQAIGVPIEVRPFEGAA